MDEPDGGLSAFFISNKVRSTLPTTPSHLARFAAKTALMLYALFVEQAALSAGAAESVRKKDGARPAGFARERACMLCGVVFVAKVLLQMAVFWRRAVSWVEVFAEAGFIFALSLASLGHGAALQRSRQLGAMEAVGVAAFAAGTYLCVAPELSRHLWKLEPGNAGRLYTLGWFGVCRHINYFGEVLSFVGFALVSGAWWNLWIPAAMGAGLVVYSVPELDAYLAERYAADWVPYTASVQCQMVPFVW